MQCILPASRSSQRIKSISILLYLSFVAVVFTPFLTREGVMIGATVPYLHTFALLANTYSFVTYLSRDPNKYTCLPFGSAGTENLQRYWKTVHMILLNIDDGLVRPRNSPDEGPDYMGMPQPCVSTRSLSLRSIHQCKDSPHFSGVTGPDGYGGG